MLERIEESADHVIVLKAAIAYYLKCIHDQVVECEQQVAGLPDAHKKLEALLSQGNRIELEIRVLTTQRDGTEAELEPLQPYVHIIDKIEELEGTIREKEELIQQKQEAIIQERQVDSSTGEFVRQEASTTIASLEHQKLILGVEVDSIGVDRDYQLRRLGELQIDRDNIRKKERGIRSRVNDVDAMIQQKRSAIDAVGATMTKLKQDIELAQPADVKLRGLRRDREHLIAVVQIVNGVSLDAEALLESAAEPVSAQQPGISV